MEARAELINGAKDTLPLILGAIPFGIIYGALGISSGLSEWGTMGMSLFVFAGSAQFIAAGLLNQGVGISIIVLTTFIVNLRHALYAASLAPYMRHLAQRWLLPLGFWLTDETYAVTIKHYMESESPKRHWYMFGSALAMYSNWQLCTYIGMRAVQQFENLETLGLDFAMVVTFIGIVVPLITTRPMLVCALVSAATGLLFYDMPNNLGLILAALCGIGAGVAIESRSNLQQNVV